MTKIQSTSKDHPNQNKSEGDSKEKHPSSSLQTSLYEVADPWSAHCYHLLSPLTPIFSFLLRSTSTCSNCYNQCTNCQSVTSLSLPLPLHNSMMISVILYAPLLLTATQVYTPPPQQLSLQVHNTITVQEFQHFLHEVNKLPFPPSFYNIQTSATDSAITQDWVHGLLVEGKNLICRIVPPYLTNHLDEEWMMGMEMKENLIKQCRNDCYALIVLSS